MSRSSAYASSHSQTTKTNVSDKTHTLNKQQSIYTPNSQLYPNYGHDTKGKDEAYRQNTPNATPSLPQLGSNMDTTDNDTRQAQNYNLHPRQLPLTKREQPTQVTSSPNDITLNMVGIEILNKSLLTAIRNHGLNANRVIQVHLRLAHCTPNPYRPNNRLQLTISKRTEPPHIPKILNPTL
jgi:hypothetical protein